MGGVPGEGGNNIDSNRYYYSDSYDIMGGYGWDGGQDVLPLATTILTMVRERQNISAVPHSSEADNIQG